MGMIERIIHRDTSNLCFDLRRAPVLQNGACAFIHHHHIIMSSSCIDEVARQPGAQERVTTIIETLIPA